MIIVFIGAMFFLVFTLQQSYQKQQFAQKITETSFQMALLRSEYSTHPSERPKTQWINTYEVLSRILDEATPLFSKTEEKVLFENTRKVSEDTRELFGQLITNVEQGGNEAVSEELSNQLTVKSQTRVSDVLHLSELSRADADNALRLFEFAMIILGILFAVISIISYFITTSIIASLQSLGEDFTRISALDFSTTTTTITTDSKDEIGILQRAFNVMVAKLKESYAGLEKKVTERTESLAEAKAQDEAILFSIGDAVMACDKDGVVMLFNGVAEVLTGYSTTKVIGHHYNQALKFVRESDEKTGEDFIAEAITTGQATKMVNHTLLIAKDGRKIPVADSAAPIKNVKGEIIGCVVVFRDVSKEREIDRAKSDFISVASHQLRTPMTSIQWVIERFLKTEKPTQKGKEYLDDIHMAVTNLSSLVDLLLNVSRIEAGKIGAEPKPLELVGFLKMYLKEQEPMVTKKQLHVIFDQHPSTFNVITDHITLRNIIHSLVSNALEYTPEGGEIEITIAKKDNMFLLTIRDTGIGIPKEEQSRSFEKFFRGANAKLVKTDGTGLGLYIAAQAVKLLQGKIWVESVAGKGSTFSVELPIESKPVTGEQNMT